MAVQRETRRRRRGASAPRTMLAGAPEASPFAPCVADYRHNLLAGTALERLDSRGLDRMSGSSLMLELAESIERKDDLELLLDDDHEWLGRTLHSYLRAEGRGLRTPSAPGEPVASNLALFAEVVSLDDAQRAVLQFLVTVHAVAGLRELTEIFGELNAHEAIALVAAATTLPVERVRRALESSGRLAASGLVWIDGGAAYPLPGKIELRPRLVDPLLAPGLDRPGLIERFLPEAAETPLVASDYEHVAETVTTARALLAAALTRGEPGVNLLFYGLTGTGKTALAALLARELGARLYVAGRADAAGESANARERLSSLLLGQRIVPRGQSLLLFDELEDLMTGALIEALLGGGAAALLSKQWFNHLLETNPVPTIWVTNSIDCVDDAFLRRFTYAIELPPLGPRHRARALARHLGSAHRLAPADVESIAARYQSSPAQLGSAVAAARLLSEDGTPDRETLERVLAPSERLLTGEDPRRRRAFDAARYRIDCLASTEDLEVLAARLARWQPGPGSAGSSGLSLCLYGPPGTGKSDYVRYLAHRMGRPVLLRRGSDLLGPYVGETEQKIAAAFRAAEQDDAVLLIDEADTFLRDRRYAQHRWEVSQVNEFLQQLEACRGVVACTTNLRDTLDAASLRRFAFKIEFGYLARTQALALFRTTFAELLDRPLSERDEASVRDALGRLDRLTPGDFSAVAVRQRALGEPASAAELAACLAAEVLAKDGAPRRAIGF